MNHPLLEKLETYYIRFKEIGQLITDPEVIQDMERSAENLIAAAAPSEYASLLRKSIETVHDLLSLHPDGT